MDVPFRLRAFAGENLNLKLVSLASALALYSMVHGSQDAQRSVRLNIVALLPASPSRMLMTTIPEKINVTVRGAKTSLDDLNSDELGSVQIDLRSGDESRVVFEPAMIPVPPGLKVEQIDPPVIDLAWEDMVARDVPVQVGVVGTPAPGYVVKGVPVAEPATIRARGPKSRVVVLQRVRADAFDVTGLTAGPYTRQLAIDKPGDRVEIDAQSVSATLTIGREESERAFTRVQVAVVGRPSAKAQPGEVDVRLTCPSDVARALRAEQIVARAQLTSQADHGSEVLPIDLSIDQCSVHVTPPTIVVRW